MKRIIFHIDVNNAFLSWSAVEMLKNGANVTEVSMHLGFCSQPYFTSAFKRELGITPSDVRKFH